MKIVKRLFALSIIVTFLFVSANSDDRRPDKSFLVMMTLNAEFLWDGIEPEEGQVDFSWKGAPSEAEEHMKNVADIIIQINPDIINLVEVENLEALNKFNDGFLAGRGYKAYFVKGKDSYTGQDVALLTRIDPEGPITRDDRKGQSGSISKSVSKNYIARMQIGNIKVALIGIHFLAQPLRQDRRADREAQADAIRSIAIENFSAGYQVVVFGDFNDYDGDDENRDHIDSMPISSVLRIVKQMSDTTDSDDLENSASLVPKSRRYTAFYDANDNGEIDAPAEFTSIDHILLSQDLRANAESAEIPHNHDPRFVTDHFPVVVRLRTQDVGGPPPTISLKIESLLPNPIGNENQNEQAAIINLGTQPVSLIGWKLRDIAGKAWALDSLGTLNPQEKKTIKRNGQPMALNNNGDTVALVDSSGNVVHSVTYGRAEEGEIITPVIQ